MTTITELSEEAVRKARAHLFAAATKPKRPPRVLAITSWRCANCGMAGEVSHAADAASVDVVGKVELAHWRNPISASGTKTRFLFAE